MINAVEHYKGNHTNCLHAPYKSRVEEVMDLPKWAVPMTKEKSDALKAQKAGRDMHWCYGWKIGVVIAMLKVN